MLSIVLYLLKLTLYRITDKTIFLPQGSWFENCSNSLLMRMPIFQYSKLMLELTATASCFLLSSFFQQHIEASYFGQECIIYQILHFLQSKPIFFYPLFSCNK
eukprot:TRINITY_DN37727_c0_g1_i1.p2 TRINITY_DN37727_c0_g1~~TRINITY_DN37727_c0_g1_i1.p2  ORF type:complete len:103 (+),score=1.30 TRINITY_DN37727_c0_g1_i1:316-624(+)